MLRFALSPTGDMTIDDLRIAIVNFIVAQKRGEPFLVRMDDTDKVRNIEGKDTEFMQILEKFSLTHDQVYHQSEHQSIHQTLALRLLEEQKAFVCTCTNTDSSTCSGTCAQMTEDAYSRLKAEGTPFVVRLKAPKETICFNDIIFGEYNAIPEETGEPVILGSDATPTALFASACDDMLSNISTVIRHAWHIGNTPKEIHIKTALGYTGNTDYAHLPNIENAPSLKQLFKEGYIPDAIINYLLLLSNPKSEQTFFTLPEAIAWFDLAQVPKTPAVFEMETLRKLNREHLLKMDDRQLSMLFGFADAAIGKLAKVYLEEEKASTVSELEAAIRPFFSPKSFDGEMGEKMSILKNIIWEAPMLDSYETFEAYLVKESGLSGDALALPLRKLLTNSTEGPALDTLYPHIKSYLLEVIS